jgi:predicted kinase
MDGMAEVVVLIGVPGAGKTTLYRDRFAPTHVRVEKKEHLAAALARGASVVVDSTNPRRADRAPIVAQAHARGARVIAYFFDVSTRAAVARNAARTGKDRVPNVAIFTVAKRLEPPLADEGFDQMFRVRIAADRSLTVEPIID